jgi:acid phosphatase type 7
MKNSCFLFLVCAVCIDISAQNLTRGPYMQSPGTSSIIIRWRTDVPTDSRVNYGTDPLQQMPFFADDATVTTEHIVKLTGLSPKTKYYYTIGSISQSLKGPSQQMHFTTAPDPLINTPVRFWAIGDFGHGNYWQQLVRDAYVDFVAASSERPADFQMWLGDNVYQDGTDYEYSTKVFDSIYGYYHIFQNLPFVSTSGNHDYNSICPWQNSGGAPTLCTKDPNTHTGPYLNLISPPVNGELGGVPSGLKLFYSFDYGDIHFICLNSELGSHTAAYNWTGVLNSDTNFTSPMLEWLKADLAATTKKWKIAYWHQCPYSGQNNFTEAVQIFCIATREHFNPILEKYGVDLVLTGHDHNYQRSYLINGHYGKKITFDSTTMLINGTTGNDLLGEPYVKYTDGPMAGKGTVYAVVGNSSGSNSPSPFEHPAIFYGQACDTCCGSLIVDINNNRLDAHYLTGYGEILDRFTIIKQTVAGVENQQDELLKDITVYPNPSNGMVFIRYTVLKKSTVKIDVLDLNGKTVYSMPPKSRKSDKHLDIIELQKENLPSGTYIIRLDCNGALYYRKATLAF